MSNLNNKKILVVNDHAPSYGKPFQHLGLEIIRDIGEFEDDPDSVALVVFTGGSDVSPDLYGKSAHPRTMNNPGRDMEESAVFARAETLGIPMAGICRGAQFICAMAGGSVIQDVTNHAGGNHEINSKWPNGEVKQIVVTSSHHQMQYPFDLPDDNYEVLAWGIAPRSRHYTVDADTNIPIDVADSLYKMEPDVVLYPAMNALAAQYHPEWMREDTEGFIYFKALVDHHLVPLMEERYLNDRQREEASQTAG